MKVTKSFIILFFIALHSNFANSQVSNCQNLGFEMGNFTNWDSYSWIYSSSVRSINTFQVMGIIPRRHTIISDTTAYDPNTGYELKKIPKGYKFSARLGDEIISTDRKPRCWQQSLRYKMKIDSANALLVLRFALVLQYASDHDRLNEPRFKMTLLDENEKTITDCSNYDFYASNKNIKGFKTYKPEGAEDPIIWCDWTTVGADLSKYIGRTIIIEFMSADCTRQYHFGYAYFVASCQPLNIIEKYCSGDTLAKLTAPEGFQTYNWTNDNGISIDTTSNLYIYNPKEGLVFNCKMRSVTGCNVSIKSTINKYIPKASFSSYMIDCNSNIVQFVNLSTSTRGSISPSWVFDDGNTEEFNPQHKFTTSGMHYITLTINNPPSTCTDTLRKWVESFTPPLVGITGDSTYCPGLGVYIKAYGAYEYNWNTGSKADSIEISAPGGKFWLVGRSSTGCVSDTIFRTISEEPEIKLVTSGDTVLCNGDTSLLVVSGAPKYKWNTGDSIDKITVSAPGKYTIIATNLRGCIKSFTFYVKKYPNPKVSFTLSTNTLDRKNYELSGHITSEDSVNYLWDLGDGTTFSGSSFLHSYHIGTITFYKIALIATSMYNCSDSSFMLVDVIPFIPNVFSPNNDGINDLFMPGIALQIFDRNGILIYEGNKGWDGTFKNKHVTPDTYFYQVQYKNSRQEVSAKKGFVTLVR